MRFYLLDRIESIEVGKRIRAVKCWTLTDDIFNDHFPGFPIVPGVLQVESMAQALGILVEKSYAGALGRDPAQEVYALMSILHKVKFKKFVLPGDKMEIEAELGSVDTSAATGTARATVDGEVRTVAEITFGLVPKEYLPFPQLTEQRATYLSVLQQKERLERMSKLRAPVL